MTKSKSQNSKNESPDLESSLDEILTSFQKSFSRNAERTNNNSGQTAKIIGDITFEMKVRVKSEGDKLIQSIDGDVELTFNGIIDPENINEK